MVNYLVKKPHQNTLWQDFNMFQVWIPTVDPPGWTVAYEQLGKSKGLCRVVKGCMTQLGKTLWGAQGLMVSAMKGAAYAVRSITKLERGTSGACP